MNRSQVLRAFGANVRRQRKQQGMSQEKLAEASSSHKNYIGAVERGERNLTLFKIVLISKALGCSPQTLVGRLPKKR